MARDSVFDVWNEVRITDHGISVTLYSECADGAVVESERYFTFDQLTARAGEIQKLNLSDETRETLREESTPDLPEAFSPPASDESGEAAYNLPEPGDVLIDPDAPDWGSGEVEVKTVRPSKRIDEWVIDAKSGKTVADANPSFDRDQPVVEARYIGDSTSNNVYAFPVERLRRVGE